MTSTDSAKLAGRGESPSLARVEISRTDLRRIFEQYVDWFDYGANSGGSVAFWIRSDIPPHKRLTVQDIKQVEEDARKFLECVISPDVPLPFALSVIESLAYRTSRFASADKPNRLVYRAAALRLLEAGLLSKEKLQRKS